MTFLHIFLASLPLVRSASAASYLCRRKTFENFQFLFCQYPDTRKMPKKAHNSTSNFITPSYYMLHFSCTNLQQQFLLEEDIPKKLSILAEQNESEAKPIQTPTWRIEKQFFNSTFNSKLFVRSSMFLHQFNGLFWLLRQTLRQDSSRWYSTFWLRSETFSIAFLAIKNWNRANFDKPDQNCHIADHSIPHRGFKKGWILQKLSEETSIAY